ncbi:hypothetical protein FQZ97_1220610 [compost metagenome]
MRVDLVALQHVLHQGAAAGHEQFPVLHAVVDLDDRRLRRLQARVGFDHHGHLGRPALIACAPMLGFVQHLRLAAKAAEDEVAVVAVLLAIGAHMPAHAGVDQRVRGDQAGFGERVGQ